MFKISNRTFYARHNNEISKFINDKDTLHIVNKSSENKISIHEGELLVLDLDKTDFNQVLKSEKKYRSILVTDVIEDYDNVFTLLKEINNLLAPDGKLIISSLNTKYILIFKFLEFLKIKDSNRNNSYIHVKNIKNLTNGIGLNFQKFYTKQIFPFKLFSFGDLLNKFLEVVFFRFNLGLKTYIIFRSSAVVYSNSSKSIIIPAKNEEGNLFELISRIPKFNDTEIIFSYGESRDNTLSVMEEIILTNNHFKFKLVKQSKNGKANAVWEALEVAENDLIAILDADISVDPETLISFFEIIDKNNADFVNGTRLVYDMEKNSMKFLNRIGNSFFQFFIGKIINETITDSLCGTKVFKKNNLYELYRWQNIIKKRDPFGDFDLIFSAAYFGNKIVEHPIIYRERKYGTTQISRFKDGFHLLIYLIASFLAFNTTLDKK